MRFLRTLCVLGMTAIHYGHLRRQNALSYLHLGGAAAFSLVNSKSSFRGCVAADGISNVFQKRLRLLVSGFTVHFSLLTTKN